MFISIENSENYIVRLIGRAIVQAVRLMRGFVRSVYGPSTVKLGDILLSIPHGASSAIRNVIYMENYERAEVGILKSILRPNDVVVEAGSALGMVALNAAALIGEDRVWMIEANRDLIPVIKKNFALNGYSCPNIIYGLASSSASNEQLEFKISRVFWSSSVLEIGNVSRVDMVPTIDLSEILKKVNATVFICDIEGGEFDLIPNIDFSNVSRVIIEIHDPLASIEKRFEFHSALLRNGFILNAGLTNGSVCLFERVPTGQPSSAH